MAYSSPAIFNHIFFMTIFQYSWIIKGWVINFTITTEMFGLGFVILDDMMTNIYLLFFHLSIYSDEIENESRYMDL